MIYGDASDDAVAPFCLDKNIGPARNETGVTLHVLVGANLNGGIHRHVAKVEPSMAKRHSERKSESGLHGRERVVTHVGEGTSGTGTASDWANPVEESCDFSRCGRGGVVLRSESDASRSPFVDSV